MNFLVFSVFDSSSKTFKGRVDNPRFLRLRNSLLLFFLAIVAHATGHVTATQVAKQPEGLNSLSGVSPGFDSIPSSSEEPLIH